MKGEAAIIWMLGIIVITIGGILMQNGQLDLSGLNLNAVIGTPTTVFTESFEGGVNGVTITNGWGSTGWTYSTNKKTAGSFSARSVGGSGTDTLTKLTGIDMSLYNGGILLTWDWRINENYDTGESVCLQVSNDGGTVWITVKCIQGNVDPEDVWISNSVESPVLSGPNFNYKLRFTASAGITNEIAYIDNLKVIGYTVPITTSTSVASTTSTIPATTTVLTTTIPATTTTILPCSGIVTLSYLPSFNVIVGTSVIPVASGLSSCAGKTILFKNSCGSGGIIISSCTSDSTGCNGVQFIPTSAGIYTYHACIDKNSDGNYIPGDGEDTFSSLVVSLTTTTIPTTIPTTTTTIPVTTTTLSAIGGLSIDDGDAGYSETGTWSTAASVCGNGGDYRFESGAVMQTARWTSNAIGTYEIFTTWCVHSARPNTVPYKISHNGGITTVNVNQKLNAQGSSSADFTVSGLKSLGVYTFNGNGYVELDSSSLGDTSADFVTWIIPTTTTTASTTVDATTTTIISTIPATTLPVWTDNCDIECSSWQYIGCGLQFLCPTDGIYQERKCSTSACIVNRCIDRQTCLPNQAVPVEPVIEQSPVLEDRGSRIDIIRIIQDIIEEIRKAITGRGQAESLVGNCNDVIVDSNRYPILMRRICYLYPSGYI